MTDEQLVDHIRQALARVDERTVEAATTRLFDRYAKRIRALVLGKMPYTERAEEIAQDVFEAATAAILAGKPIDNFKAWIFRVARNKIADFWRSDEGQQIKLDRAAAEADEPTNLPEEGVSGDDQDLFELEDLIEQAMDGLRDSHRRIVELNVFDCLDAGTTAERTGESTANVYQVVKRFRDRLRRLLEDNDYEVGS